MQVVCLLHVLDPFVCLSLWINHQGPTSRITVGRQTQMLKPFHITLMQCSKEERSKGQVSPTKAGQQKAWGTKWKNDAGVSVCEPTYTGRPTNRSQLPLVTCAPSSASIKFHKILHTVELFFYFLLFTSTTTGIALLVVLTTT